MKQAIVDIVSAAMMVAVIVMATVAYLVGYGI